MEEVTSQSHELRRELGLRDIVLAQLLIIIGTASFGPAARLGASHAVIWIAGIALFHIPLALVVAHLNRQAPLEGGLYQWAKLTYGEVAGFMTAWNTWLFFVFFTSLIGLTVTTALSYAFAARALAASRMANIAAGAVVLAGLALLAALGLRIGRRVHNAAMLVFLLILATLIALPFATGRGMPVMSLAVPPLTLVNVAIFTKTLVFALAGYETLPILAGECRDPQRTIARSMVISVPLIAAIYILGTNAILAFVPPESVDLINPFAQAFGAATPFASLAIVLILAHDLATSSQVFAANARLPMTAGWDRLLPAWFARLHPVRKTPVNSIAFIAVLAFAVGVAAQAGVSHEEAFQVLQSAAGILFASTYLVMFSIPFVRRAPWPVRLAAASGFAVTALFCAVQVVPIIAVESAPWFAARIVGVVVLANAVGLAIVAINRRMTR